MHQKRWKLGEKNVNMIFKEIPINIRYEMVSKERKAESQETRHLTYR